jgi:hypothetical protein
MVCSESRHIHAQNQKRSAIQIFLPWSIAYLISCTSSGVTQTWPYFPGGTVGYPAPPRLIRQWVRPSFCPWVRLSLCTCLQIRYPAENSTGPTDSVNYSSESWIHVNRELRCESWQIRYSSKEEIILLTWRNRTRCCQKSGRFFVNTQDTIYFGRERGLQRRHLSCTHALKYYVTSV